VKAARIVPQAWRTAALVALAFGLAVPEAAAQAPGAPRARWEVGGGVVWVGGVDFGRATAEETRNPGTGSGPFDLFVTDNELGAAPGLVARVGYNVTPVVGVEGGIRVTRPELTYKASADAEEATDITATETLTQWVFDGSIVLHLTGLTFAGGRGVPFIAAGAGYLRDLHDGSELLETGTEYHGTAGVKVWFGARARAGFRAEGGVSNRDGFDLSSKRRTVPVASASLTYRF